MRADYYLHASLSNTENNKNKHIMILSKHNNKMKGNSLPTLEKGLSLFFQSLYVFVYIIFSNLYTPVFADTLITNTATANFSINGTSQSLSDSIQFTKDTVVTPTDSIFFSKSVSPSSAYKGDLVIYSLAVTNPNSNSLSNVVIKDTLSTGLIYQIGTATLNNTAINNSQIDYSGNLLTINLGTLPANSSGVVHYAAKANTLGSLINRAFATSDSATSNQDEAIVSISTRPITEPLINPLNLTKAADKKRVKLEDLIHYTLSIANNNDTAVSAAILKDVLPAELAYITGSATLNSNPIEVKILENSNIEFNLGNIPAKAKWVFSYDAKVINTDNKVLTNKAFITTANPNAHSNTATVSVDVSDDKIILGKTANKTKVEVGDTVEYTIVIKNPANHSLSHLNVNDVLPQGFIYQEGSSKVNGRSLANSAIYKNGNALLFSIGSLDAKKSVTLRYQVKVIDNAIPGKAINSASANSDLAISDTVTATVNLRTPSTIKFLKINEAGKESTIQPTSYNDSKDGGKHWQEVKTITLADGTKVSLPIPQPLIDAEQYTLNDPVVIEVKDLDQNTNPDEIDTIIIVLTIPNTGDKEVLLLKETSPNSGIFRGAILTTADTSNKQDGVLSIKEGSNISATYRDDEDTTDTSVTAALVTPDSLVSLEKQADKESASIGEQVRYTVSINNRSNFSIPDLKLSDTLPLGFRYISGSASLNGKVLKRGVSTDGRTIHFKLGNMPLGDSSTLEYLTKITSGVQYGKAINTVRLDNTRLASNVANATVIIKDDLMRTKNILTGRVYIGCKTGKGSKVLKDARIYTETGRSVVSDKEGFWHMEGIQAGTHVLQLDGFTLPNGYEPMLCHDNTRRAGNASSQFVNLQAGNIWQVDFHVTEVATTEKLSIQNDDVIKEPNPLELYGKSYLTTAAEGFEILWPKNNYVPPVASTKIVVKSSPQHHVDVFLNGKKVNPLNYDGSETNKARTVVIRRWVGVDIDIHKKNNTLLVITKDKSGKEVARKTHNIHFSSAPASAEFVPELSVLIADGKTAPIIALRIKDKDGFPMRANTQGYYSIDNNRFQAQGTESESNNDTRLNRSSSGNKYQIGANGIAKIKLQPTTQSGEIKLKLKFTDSNDKVIRAWLKPKLREWILVGLAEGTLAHNTLSGNMKTLSDLDASDTFKKNGRIAFFAKGKVKGKYLLTVAYDTHKQKQKIGDQLEGNIDPDAWYTIYADNSNNQFNASSSRKLYLKIEKDNFYAVFGDYHTAMSVAELATYERVLNGIKSEYQGKNISYNAFVSETSNKHHHDEIPGDGSSGLYYLSNDIISNSESVKIETRDRFHSERIITTRELSRYQDYDIDYNTGALFFKFPVTGRDKNFNPNIIVVDYDSETDNNKEIVAGGRVAYKTDDEKLKVGVSIIHTNRKEAKNDSLVAVDTTYQITPDTKVHAEIAQSKTEKSNFDTVQAQILEIEKQISNMEAKIFYRKLDKNFGINAKASEVGTQKVGAELRYQLNDKTSLTAEVSRQKNLENDNTKELAEARVKHQYKQLEVSAGVRHSKEELLEEKLSNNTFLVGGKYTTEKGNITLRTNIEKNIGSQNSSELSPDRANVGIDIKLKEGITLFAEHEVTNNDKTTTQNTRIGLSKDLWKGAKAKTTYTQEHSHEGQRNYATLGLTQKIKLTDTIRADFSIDHAKTIGTKQKHFNKNEPATQGTQTDDYTAFSVGLGSDEKDWSWTSRFELRKGELEDKINVIASVIRRLDDGKQLSGKLSYYNSDKSNGEYKIISKLSLGSAWHPSEDNFVFFSRLDLVDEKSNTNNTDSGNQKIRTQKIVHNMHYSRKLNNKTQLALHHGIKRIIDKNKQSKLSATIDTGTVEIRHDINKKWDIGVKGGYLRDWTEKTTETMAGISMGVTPAKNAWFEMGYNFKGFDDSDFDNNNYKQKGAYLNFTYKFDQNSLKKNEIPSRSLKATAKQ